eukprot:6195015-Pleurochrysis_carterae.AAC.2
MEALRKASQQTHSPEKTQKLRRGWTATAKMLAHTDWDSTEVIREIETATLAGNPSCTDTSSVKLPEDTREREPRSVR